MVSDKLTGLGVCSVSVLLVCGQRILRRRSFRHQDQQRNRWLKRRHHAEDGVAWNPPDLGSRDRARS